MAPETQAKLLRVLEKGELLRLGSVKPIHVDVRFIAATNRDLQADAAAGRFRSDLLFRLNGYSITLPPLRRRRTEILPLAHAFLERAATRSGKGIPQLSDAACSALVEHTWPGNVRELRAAIDRAFVVSSVRGVIEPADLALAEAQPRSPAPPAPATPEHSDATAPSIREALQHEEKARVLDALRRAKGSQTEAAKLLGVSRRTIINKIEAFGIERPRKGRGIS
jgi:DNA-binding NtrC family response regulator